jgi:hypothetical protein
MHPEIDNSWFCGCSPLPQVNFMGKHFLLLVAETMIAEDMLLYSVTVARQFDAQVTLLCVLGDSDPGTSVVALDWPQQKAEAEAALAQAVVQLQAAGVPTQVVKIVGPSAMGVINYIHHQQVDLVIWSHPRDCRASGSQLGELLPELLRRSQIPMRDCSFR